MPLTDELTTDYQSAGAQSQAHPERITVALVRGAGPQPTNEIRVLLRTRLRIATLILLGAGVIALPGTLALGHPTERQIMLAVGGPLIALTAVLTWLLWRKPTLSLRTLRAIELFFFSGLTGVLGALTLGGVLHDILLSWVSQGAADMQVGVRSLALPWFSVMILYGTFIPNTWRRCAVVVGGIGVLPLSILALGGLLDDRLDKGLLLIILAEMTFWMALGAALAIYGSHRIEVLRRVALAVRQMGQYRLKERLGAGGMGEVYLAEHILLRRPCALKLIRPERTGDPKHPLRFEREVQATAALTHPNTVQVFDYGHAEDGTFYYAMEYLPGLNLEELVKRYGPLSPERAVHLLRQACGALHEAHAAGLIHRDIKPSNIITCERGDLHDVAKLLDFGLVRSYGLSASADHLTQDGALAGTPAYMSPEQADGKKDLDARSDLYSLGAVAYYLLTGQPPFVRPTPLQTLIAHACDPPIPPDQLRAEVPTDLQAVVLRCLEKDPARRFPCARSLDTALAGCQAAGLWTEERAVAWWHGQSRSANGANSLADATMGVAEPLYGLESQEGAPRTGLNDSGFS
jgi:serine/threonine-protein kinase